MRHTILAILATLVIAFVLSPVRIHAHVQAETQAAPTPITIPFELVGRLVRVEASIEGRSGYFLLDSGAAATVLNAAAFQDFEDRAKPMDHPVTGVGGAMHDVRVVPVRDVQLGSIRIPGLHALYQDLSHLEKNVGTSMLGLIGMDILRQFTVELDYEAEQLALYLDGPSLATGSGARVLPFEWVGQLPVIDVRIGEQVLRMGIDSGAEGAMLDPGLATVLAAQTTATGTEVIRGADLNETEVPIVDVSAFEVAGLSYRNHEFSYLALHGTGGVRLDGLLGYDFLSAYRTAINFRDGEIYFWEE